MKIKSIVVLVIGLLCLTAWNAGAQNPEQNAVPTPILPNQYTDSILGQYGGSIGSGTVDGKDGNLIFIDDTEYRLASGVSVFSSDGASRSTSSLKTGMAVRFSMNGNREVEALVIQEAGGR